MISTPETRAMAQAVLDYIESHPEEHDQGSWQGYGDCGTTMCVGGTALFLKYGDVYAWRDHTPGSMSMHAGALLGFKSEAESDILFYDMDNRAAVNKLEKIAAGKAFSGADFLDKDGDPIGYITEENYTFTRVD